MQADVLAFTVFPKAHRLQIHSTNPLERLNAEIKCRAALVETPPNVASTTRLLGALLREQNDERQLQRYSSSVNALAPWATINPLGSAL